MIRISQKVLFERYFIFKITKQKFIINFFFGMIVVKNIYSHRLDIYKKNNEKANLLLDTVRWIKLFFYIFYKNLLLSAYKNYFNRIIWTIKFNWLWYLCYC